MDDRRPLQWRVAKRVELLSHCLADGDHSMEYPNPATGKFHLHHQRGPVKP